jgi:hypothetical protein
MAGSGWAQRDLARGLGQEFVFASTCGFQSEYMRRVLAFPWLLRYGRDNAIVIQDR